MVTIKMLSRYKPVNTPLAHWNSAIVALLIAICLFFASAVCATSVLDFIGSASRAKGVVVRQTAGKHHVEVKFETAKGDMVTYQQNGLISYEAGDTVTVLYKADNPRMHPSTDGFGAVWGVTLMLIAMGIFLICSASLTIFKPHLVHIRGFGT